MVISQIPESLRIWSYHRNQLLKDFNEILEQYILLGKQRFDSSPLIIFTFSEQNECTPQFLNKLFSRRIMNEFLPQGLVATIKINPPTDREVDKILHDIINKECGQNCNLALNKF